MLRKRMSLCSFFLVVLFSWGWTHAAQSSPAASKLAAPQLYLPENGIQIGSFDGARKLLFIWVDVATAAGYRLQICKDTRFSSVLVDTKLSDRYYPVVNPPDNQTLYWRVCAIDSTGIQGAWSGVSRVTLGYPERAGLVVPLAITDEHVLGVVPLAPRKDTRMLCLDAAAGEGHPGCQLNTSSHPWNGPHDSGPNSNFCEHEIYGCWLVAAQMLNHYRGHNITYDELTYEMFRTHAPTGAPEGDSPHGVAGSSTGSGDDERSMMWALKVELPALHEVKGTKPSQDEIIAFINPPDHSPGRPIRWTAPSGGVGHTSVIDGYHFDGGFFCVHELNPYNNGSAHWPVYSTLGFVWYMCPDVGTSGVNSDPTVNIDSDGDGIVDFDEVKRFGTNPNDPDSDHDGISDMTEVFSYAIARSPKVDPDVDHDGRRAELDFDSDGGGMPDGYEDRNCNGILDAGETDVYSGPDGAIPANLTLTNMTISTTQTYLARNSVSVAPSVTVTSAADVIFAAGNTINLNSGLQTNNGLKMKVRVDPNLR